MPLLFFSFFIWIGEVMKDCTSLYGNNRCRSIPLSKSKKDLNESQMSGSSPGLGSPRQSEDLDKVSNLFVEEALPFSLKPFVVHPPNGAKDRTPTLSECQAIIAQLSFHCQHQHEEVSLLVHARVWIFVR